MTEEQEPSRCGFVALIGAPNAGKTDWLDKVGFVPKENLIGPAKILFWSYGSSFQWYNPITWATALRFGRLLNVSE